MSTPNNSTTATGNSSVPFTLFPTTAPFPPLPFPIDLQPSKEDFLKWNQCQYLSLVNKAQLDYKKAVIFANTQYQQNLQFANSGFPFAGSSGTTTTVGATNRTAAVGADHEGESTNNLTVARDIEADKIKWIDGDVRVCVPKETLARMLGAESKKKRSDSACPWKPEFGWTVCQTSTSKDTRARHYYCLGVMQCPVPNCHELAKSLQPLSKSLGAPPKKATYAQCCPIHKDTILQWNACTGGGHCSGRTRRKGDRPCTLSVQTISNGTVVAISHVGTHNHARPPAWIPSPSYHNSKRKRDSISSVDGEEEDNDEAAEEGGRESTEE